MKGTHCPSCNQDIGYWSVIKAGWPTLLKCPHCHKKLCYRPTGWAMILLLTIINLAVSISILFGFLKNQTFNTPTTLIITFIISLVIWSGAELFLVKRMRQNSVLSLNEKDQ